MDSPPSAPLIKWPNVPACYGWLSLDHHGQWRIRDEAAQHNGTAGGVITHPGLIQFINRHYTADEHGAWTFQNGPQRVYVDLDAAPFVLSVDLADRFSTHTGEPVEAIECLDLDETGRLFARFRYAGLASSQCGLICDRDLSRLIDRFVDAQGQPVEANDSIVSRITTEPLFVQLQNDWRLPIRSTSHAALREWFGFQLRPRGN